MKYLYGHNSQETAYIVEDYPWGFRLRTTIRYWIESKKGFGQRFCSQTINPKTGLWCKPKCSTYNEISVLFLNKDNHIKVECLRTNSRQEVINKFKETHLDKLDEFQLTELKNIELFNKVMEKVTFSITESEVVFLT